MSTLQLESSTSSQNTTLRAGGRRLYQRGLILQARWPLLLALNRAPQPFTTSTTKTEPGSLHHAMLQSGGAATRSFSCTLWTPRLKVCSSYPPCTLYMFQLVSSWCGGPATVPSAATVLCCCGQCSQPGLLSTGTGSAEWGRSSVELQDRSVEVFTHRVH